MRYRVDYYLRCDTQAQAIAVSMNAETAIINEDNAYERAHGPEIFQDGDLHFKWMATGGGWFSTQQKARRLQRNIETSMNNDVRVLPGSVVELHPCNNEDSSACLPSEVERIIKAA